MRLWRALVLFALLAFPLGRPGFTQVPGNPGFNTLLCAALASGAVQILNDDHNGTAEVFIAHGKSGTGSFHTVFYDDVNGTGEFDCGDAIVGIE